MGANIYRNKKPVLVFLVPAFLFMILFLYYPFLKNIMNSFMHIKQLGSSAASFNTPWYSNYVEIIHDENVWTSIKNTLIMMVVTLIGQVGIAIILALMVDNIRRGKQFFKTVFFFPIVISATALGLLFNLLFLYDKGMVNQLLEALGKSQLTDWKAEGIALFTMMLPVMWQYVGFYFVILITGLNNISDELYEAARIDGASGWSMMKGVILPLMMPAFTIGLFLSISSSFKMFDQNLALTKGGPYKSTEMLALNIYNSAFGANEFGFAQAKAIVFMILVAAIGVTQLVITKKKEVEM